MSSSASATTSATPAVAFAKSVTKPVTKTPTNVFQPNLGIQLLTAGTAACVADMMTFPLDTVKVRLQVQGEGAVSLPLLGNKNGVFRTFGRIVKQEGVRSLYKGIVPGLQRQMAFSGIRIGAYENVKKFYQNLTGVNAGAGLMAVRIAAGVTTGTMAILAAQPTDVVKIRMQAEKTIPGKLPRYRGVMDAYLTIGRTEGISGLYKGTCPNIARNCIINIGELVVYDVAKETLMREAGLADDVPCHFLAALTAGFTATIVALPVDVVKTRFMNSPKGKYRGAFNCAVLTWRNEGFLAFYKGFNASFSRLVCWNVCLWLTYEQFKLAVIKLNS